MSDSEVVENIKQKQTWMRGAFMLLFVLLYSVAELVMLAVVLLQFAFSLFTRNPNTLLTRFGMQLSTYLYSIFRFLTFNSDIKPFPFESWPNGDDTDLLPGNNTRGKESSESQSESPSQNSAQSQSQSQNPSGNAAGKPARKDTPEEDEHTQL